MSVLLRQLQQFRQVREQSSDPQQALAVLTQQGLLTMEEIERNAQCRPEIWGPLRATLHPKQIV